MPPPLPLHRRRRNQLGHQNELESSSDKSAMDRQASELTPSELQQATRLSVAKPTLPVVQTATIDLARMQQWQRLISRITSHRQEAKQTDSDGLMPLHWACSGGPPVEVIEALLKAYRRAAKRTDSSGSTALHFACHYGGSAQVIEALLKAYPKAVRKKDNYGRTPLYHAVNKTSSLYVIKTLIEADPSMAIEPCIPPKRRLAQSESQDRRPLHHRTPLFMIWSMVTSLPHARRRRRNGKAWEKAVLLLEAADRARASRKNDQCTFRALHAMIKFDSYLPSHAISLALERYPQQLREPQESDGRLPLAIAADSSSPRASELIQLVCQAYPQAAHAIDCAGQTPLVIALASGKQWHQGVETLFEEAPESLSRRDRKTRLYPALVSAFAQKKPLTKEEVDAPVKAVDGKKNDLSPSNESKKSLQWRNQALSNVDVTIGTIPSSASDWDRVDPESSHLSTVYKLVRSSPSIVKW